MIVQESAGTDNARWPTVPACLPPQGLAHCFRKDDNGKLMDHFVIEPISANSLEVCTHPWTTCSHSLHHHDFFRLFIMACMRMQWATPVKPHARTQHRSDGIVSRQAWSNACHGMWQCMAAGGKTCFKEVVSLKLGSALAKDTSDLPAEWAGAAWCENYEFRAGACARTWARQHAQDNLMCVRACCPP